MYYEIQVRAHLNSDWADWFGGLAIRNLDDGRGVLTGVVPDQTALMGILNRIHALNIPLLSVNSIEAPSSGAESVEAWDDP